MLLPIGMLSQYNNLILIVVGRRAVVQGTCYDDDSKTSTQRKHVTATL